MKKEKIVVTGIGVISSIGYNKDEFMTGLKNGKSGRNLIQRFDVSNDVYLTKYAACLLDFEDKLNEIDESKIATIALYSAKEAIEDSQIDLDKVNPFRMGISIGTSHGGNHSVMKFKKQQLELVDEPVDHSLLFLSSPTMAGIVSKQLGIQGPNMTISTACSSSTTSIGYAMDMLANNKVDVMLAGGADIFSELSFSGFNCLKLLTDDLCRPLSKGRSGLMLGEGSAMFVLEREQSALKRNARIYAELPGYAIGNEAFHETAPDASGINIYNLMNKALENANVNTDEVDYVNTHGTGTVTNDPTELSAIKRLFNSNMKNMCVSSTKSMIGHALGAAGCLELATTLLAMENDFIPPTINFEEPIEGLEDINVVPNKAIEKGFNVAMYNSFAYAGHIASIVIKKY